jgi:hypothetical protein
MTVGTISIIIGVVLLVLLKLFFKDEENLEESNGVHGVDDDEFFKEEPEFDRTWSFLPGNIFNRSNDD